MNDYTKWGFDTLEVQEILYEVKARATQIEPIDLKKVFNQFEKAVANLRFALKDFQKAAENLPEDYIQNINVVKSISLVDQTSSSLRFPNVFIKHKGERLPAKGIIPQNRVVLFLAGVYQEKTGKDPKVSVDVYKDNQLSGDFVQFIKAIESDAGLNMPKLARRAKELLKPVKQ